MRLLAFFTVLMSLAASTTHAASVFVDDFTTGPLGIVEPTGGPPTVHAPQTGLPGASVLGGSRAVTLENQGGIPTIASELSIDIPVPSPLINLTPEAGLFKVFSSPGSSSVTTATLTYGGAPLDLTIDFMGLIGTAETSFIVFDFAAASGLNVIAEATDSDNDVATTTFVGNTGIEETVVFSEWTNAGSVDFDDISSLRFTLTSTQGGSFDANSIRLGTTLPEPSGFVLMGGLAAIGMWRRRRNS